MSQAVPSLPTPGAHDAPAVPTTAPSGHGTADVRLLVTRLTVVLNRRRAYDAAHPMVRQAEEALLESLQAVLGDERTLTLGIAHRELLVDGEPFTQGAAAGRELAERLHRRSVAGLTLQGTVSMDDMRVAVGWLAFDPSAPRAGQTRSSTVERRRRTTAFEEPPDVPGFIIARVPYDRLAMLQRAAEQRRELQTIWRLLAKAAQIPVDAAALRADADDAADWQGDGAPASGDGGRDGPADGRGSGEATMAALAGADGDDVPVETMADAIEVAVQDRSQAREIGYVLQRMALELREVLPEVRAAVAERLRDLLMRLRQTSLAAIIDALGDADARHRFITSLVDVLPASAVVDWLERTASLTEQQISHHLLRVLAKLSTLASDQRPGARVARDFREAARRLVDEWTLTDPNPSEHDSLLDYIAIETLAPADGQQSPIAVPEAPTDLPPADLDALRLVQMACELDVVGEDTVVAASRLVEDGQYRLLLDVLASAPGNRARAALGDTLFSANAPWRVLVATPFDATEAKLLLSHVRIEHAPILLDALADAPERSARRLLLDALRDFGPPLLPLLVHQLEPGAVWYYLRNILVLLRDLLAEAGPDAPERLRAPLYLSFLDHPWVQVRIEALRLALDLPSSRSIGLLRAIEDESDRVAAIAIDALIAFAGDASLEASVRAESSAFAQRLTRLVDRQRFDPDLLARAVRAMQIDASSGTREWLLRHVTRRSRLLRRRRLTEARPSVLAALRVLTLIHAGNAHVDEVLARVDQCKPGDPRRTTVERARAERAARGRHPDRADSAPASSTPAGATA